MDITESLLQLHSHGIVHNDVTFRNTVRVGTQFKLIDFDVARMHRKEVDFSLHSPQQVRVIEGFREETIRCSQRLLRKELQEDRVVAFSGFGNVVPPVENINRLAEYYHLRNFNPVRDFIAGQSAKSGRKQGGLVLSREEKLMLLGSYEGLTVGKTDCNKWGLVLMKLMHVRQGRFSIPFLEICINGYLRDVYQFDGSENGEGLNYNDLAVKFRLDEDLSIYTQIEVHKLIAQLFIPNLSRRIPMRLFALELLDTLNIKHYGLKADV
jgi:hypothetical protein